MRELKVRVESLEKQMNVRFNAMEQKIDTRSKPMDAQSKAIDAQFEAVMASIGESKAQAELINTRVIAALSEPVAVLESQRH